MLHRLLMTVNNYNLKTCNLSFKNYGHRDFLYHYLINICSGQNGHYIATFNP